MEWERQTWMEEYEAGERISEIAQQYGVSRRTIHKWIERWQQYGQQGLEDLSRAPHQHPQAVEEVWKERVRSARQQHPRWGAPKLAWLLKQGRQGEEVPSISTIGRVLRESGLSRGRRAKPRTPGTGELQEAEQPNQVWAIDFKGWCRTGDGARCEPLTISDQASRYLLCCQGLTSTRTELVRPVMERVFERYGVPARMRSDNGAPFASVGECGLTELSVWWMELGVECERIQPGHPQQNGRHERMHRTLKEATMEPPAATFRQQQRRFDEFREEYNQARPHEALGQRVPASLYVPAAVAYSRKITEPEYPSHWPVRKVDGGQMRWMSQRIFVSHALTGKTLGWEPVGEGAWKVWFYRHWLGTWEEAGKRFWRPAELARREARGSPAG
jgi:putative transposase